MSTERKVMKVLSLLLLVFGIIFGVLSVMLCLSLVGKAVIPSEIALTIEAIGSAVVAIMSGISGIKGANTPSKADGFAIWCVIGAVFELATLVASYVAPTVFGELSVQTIASTAVEAAILIVGALIGHNVSEHAKK